MSRRANFARTAALAVGAAELAAAGVALLLAATPAAAAPCALVSAQDAGLVDVVDCAARAVTARIAVGALPVGLAVDADGRRLYVTRPEAGAIGVVDLAACRLVGTFDGLGTPFAVAAAAGRLLVTDWNGDRLVALDPATGRTLAQAATGKAPAGLAVDVARGRVYVAEREADRIGVFALPDLAPLGSVEVGTAPFAVALDGDQPVAVNVRSGDLSVIDAETLSVVATVKVGQMPYAAAATAAGRLIVTNQQSGTVSLVAVGGGAPAEMGQKKVGAYPEGVAIVDGGRYALVADWFSDDVRLVDPASGETLATIATDAGPRLVVSVAGPVCTDAPAAPAE